MKVIQAKGSFRSVGQKVGEATREDIRFMRRVMVPELLKSGFGGDELSMARDGRAHFLMAKNNWPETSEYASGLAEGANLTLSEIIPIVFLEEMSVALGGNFHRDRCSTLLVRTENDGWLVGHQEDYRDIFYDKLSVLDLQFKDRPRLVSLNYPGTFPGMAASLNSSGVAMTCNALWPEPVPGLGKQSKHFMAALEEYFVQALSWIGFQPHILTDHFLVIGGNEDLAATMEVTGRPEAPKQLEVREIVHDRDPEADEAIREPFTHTNHVKMLEPWVSGIVKDPAHQGSALRQRVLDRIACSDPPRTPQGMLELLQKKDGILNRNSENNRTGQPNSITLATVVIQPSTCDIWVVGYGKDESEQIHLNLKK